MATMTWGMAIIATGSYGLMPTVAVTRALPVVDPESIAEEYPVNTAVSGSLPTSGNDCQSDDNHCQIREIVAHTPAERAAAYAVQLVEWCAGETYDWSDVQIDYRRFAKQQKWRLEIADRILSKALKDAGCVRAQEDRRREGKGRPITITVPWRDA